MLESTRGDIQRARRLLDESAAQFRYLQTVSEPVDVERNRCQAELIAGERRSIVAWSWLAESAPLPSSVKP